MRRLQVAAVSLARVRCPLLARSRGTTNAQTLPQSNEERPYRRHRRTAGRVKEEVAQQTGLAASVSAGARMAKDIFCVGKNYHEHARDFIGDWENRAQRLLAEFPADTAHNREDLGMQDLIRGAGVPTINHSLTALRLLFMVTLRKSDVVARLPFVLEPRRLPVVLSLEEPRHVTCVHFPYIKH
jgi:hypothetical protein